jgi:hypothetical protein
MDPRVTTVDQWKSVPSRADNDICNLSSIACGLVETARLHFTSNSIQAADVDGFYEHSSIEGSIKKHNLLDQFGRT